VCLVYEFGLAVEPPEPVEDLVLVAEYVFDVFSSLEAVYLMP
jgi:hypothetical protein